MILREYNFGPPEKVWLGPKKHPTIRNPKKSGPRPATPGFPQAFTSLFPSGCPQLRFVRVIGRHTHIPTKALRVVEKQWKDDAYAPWCGIFAHIYLKFMVNVVGKYSLRGASRWCCKEKQQGLWWKHHADSWDVCSLLSASIFFKNHVVYCDDCIMYCLVYLWLPSLKL